MLPEPMLIKNPDRFVVSITHNDIYQYFLTHRKMIWNENEIDLVPDIKDWLLLSNNERHFIKNVLAFFASSDGIVLENLSTNFSSEVQYPEARLFYTVQSFMESIHSITYANLIDTYVSDINEKARLFKAIEHIPAIKKKADWALNWITSKQSFATRLVAFAIVEGVFFSGSFCCIYWLNESGRMPGLCKSNDFIARDEGLHTDFACMLYKDHIANKLTDKEIHTIMSNAVDIEIEFITESLPCNLLGMNSSSMSEYIKYVADRLLKQLGHAPIYKVNQPFTFMERICLDKKTNFFEARVSEYQASTDSYTLDNLNLNIDF